MIQLQSWPIEWLIEYARNPRKNDHAVDKIAAAIKEFGFRVPIVAKSDGLVVDGHLRLKAAKKLNLSEVPVILADDMTDAQIKAFRISVNKMAEMAEWDNDLLAIELAELQEIGFDLELTGFTEEDLKALTPVEVKEGLTDEDAVPEVPEEPKTKPGDIYQLGRHRLMCGDSTSIDAVEKLMDGQKADMVFTDPPYGMFLNTNYDTMFSNDKTHKKTGDRFGVVKGDHDDFDPDFINTIFAAFNYCKEIFLWGADYYVDLIPNRNDGSWVVWDKRCDEKMDKVVGNTFELCWSKAKHKRVVARILWSGHHGMHKDDTKTRVHPTQKPVELVCWFFDYYSMADKKIIVDLFGGSGSTLIACEKTNRQARLMELEPKYCDVIVKRWEDFTGQKATLIEHSEL